MIPDLTPQEIERFYSNVYLGGCGIVWGGSEVNNHGYGRFPIYRNGKRVRILVHRLSYYLATGHDPGESKIRHGCDTPPCCTPDCLEPGTQADNVRDAVKRGRINTSGLSAQREARDAAAAERLVTGRKRCSRCGQTKSLDDFCGSRNEADGHAYWCRSCTGEHQRKRRGTSERQRRALKRASRKAAA